MLCCCKGPNKSKKVAICGIITIVCGVLLILIAIIIPIIFKSVLRDQIPTSVAVSKQNQDQWDALPGKFNIEVIKRVYLYNCTNPEDVVMTGAKPELTELDPVPYLDIQKFMDVNYTRAQIPWDTKQNERDAAVYKYWEYYTLYNGTQNFPVPDIYKKTFVGVNPAAFGIWYGLKNAEKWRTQLGALYSVTVDGLGNSLIRTIAFNLMVDENFKDENAVKASLWPASDDVTVDTNKTKLIRNDKYYGLHNADNVAKWYALCSTDNNTKIEFQNEIFTYFSISRVDMMAEATNNFCSIVDSTVKFLQSACPKKGSKPCDASDFAYWQWANSYFTKLPALGLNKESVTQLDDTVLGYPEINFFIPTFLKKLNDTQHKGEFDSINFGSPKSEINYSHLFFLPKRDYFGEVPKTSLFNLDTLKAIFSTIETMVDIYEDPSKTVDYSTFSNFTKLLKLTNDKQTYLLLIWMKNMLEVTAMRKDQGGTYLTTNMMGLGQDGLQGSIGWMSREFPAFLYGNIMALSNSNKCEKNVNDYIRGVDPTQIPKFCNDTKLNLVSAESYSFYASIYFTRDYDKIKYIYDHTGLSEQAMLGMLTPGYYLERNLMTAMKKVKKVYANDICSRSVGLFCSNRELAYAQWFNNSISSMPPKPLNSSANLIDLTGAHHFKPEVYTYYKRTGTPMPEVTLGDVWDMLSSGQMFNQKFIGDVLLNQPSKGKLQLFNTPTFKRYLKMLMIEQGMGGLFIERTVKEYIEGFTDKILQKASKQTLEEGGDPTISPWMSINDSPTSPINGTDCFFVGGEKYDLTRQYCFWLNNRYMRMQLPQLTGLRSYETKMVNPWKVDVPIQGTDGGQFKPLLEKEDTVYLFVSDIMMPVKFNFNKEVSINGMTGWKFVGDESLKLNSTEYPENERFYQGIHGTLNLTSVLGAPLFATKGHYLDLDYNQHLTSNIYTKDGKKIVGDEGDDDIYMTAEPWTGLSLSGGQRLMLNFLLEKDDLFEYTNSTYLVPYTYVKREFTLNKEQIDQSLGDVKIALGIILGVQITGYLLGSLLLLGGIGLILWSCRIKKFEGLGDYKVVEEYKPDSVLEKKPLLNGSSHMTNEETKDDNVSR